MTDTSSTQPASSMLDTGALINRYVGELDQLKQQLKEQRDMLKSAFENDSAYHDISDKVKHMNKQKNAVKQTLLKQPAAMTASQKVKELREEITDKQSALSGYLQEYQQISGTNVIEGEDGEWREIVPVYRLVKRSSK